MHEALVGIVGGSGYSGIELCRLLANHTGVSVRFVTSDRWAGNSVRARTGVGGAMGGLNYLAPDKALEAAADCDVVLMCTPAEASLQSAPELLRLGKRVVDFSGAFRLANPALYPAFYGLTHPRPELLGQAVYGLPELSSRKKIGEAKLLANPGCYATASALSVAPLLASGMLDPDSVVINGSSGVTGAGRKANEEFSFTEVADDFRAYKVLKHQHTPEIDQTLSVRSGQSVRVTFTPHLLPLKRGIVCTTFARTLPSVNAAAISAVFADAYGKEPFITLLDSPEAVQLKAVVGTNQCLLGFAHEGNRLVVLTAIDNLVKGAAGQAVQNLNLMLGLPENTGLQSLSAHHP